MWFSAYPTLSARNIDDNSALRDGLAGALTDGGGATVALAAVKHGRPHSTSPTCRAWSSAATARLPHATFLAAARCATRPAPAAFLRDRVDDVTTGLGPAAGHALNIAFTAPGLVAVGLPDDVVAGGFAAPFVEGMATEHRRRLLGDVGTGDAGALGLGRAGHRRRST